jgi:hypothetical protein
MSNSSSSDKHSHADQALRESREHRNSNRFRQLNDLLVGHAEGSLQYLLAVNGGGCIAMLGLVGAVEKWRLQNWPYWVLATFVIGLIFAGIGRAALLIHVQHLLSGWLKDTAAYYADTLDYHVLYSNDNGRVKRLRWLPWTIGAGSLLCFIGGAIAAGYLFFTLR